MRLQIIRLKLEDDPNNNIYLYVDKNKTLLGNKLKVLLELYKEFAEAVELVNREIHASVFICVVCSLPKLISYVYSIFLVFEGHAVYITFEFISVHVLQVCLYLFLPFVVSEGYSIEIEKIQLILMNKLIKETDKSTKEDIDLFLRYIDVKNFKYKVWRIMPLSITFPLELINICTTYVIVLINFTHLYD
ncbi:uncharacterized protein LOC125488795 [Plutella xylostella]|uniref:uncharacterized protein LOC125488795 n=1 Tax=Plutella xylostella TaxID=51655 RepID=UPI002032A2CB|nr:uncharacterized protein LOC125488795 [Plutella xylostella]